MERRPAVAIQWNRFDNNNDNIVAEIAKILEKSDISAYTIADTATQAAPILDQQASAKDNTICMITVGGDGTILSYGKLAAKFKLPLLGVNTGRLGFMATLEVSELERIPEILSHEFRISSRMMMGMQILRKNGGRLVGTVLNDVVVRRDSTSKLPEFSVSYGEYEVTRLRADGVIFSTATGSTAYALSAGGPILAPNMRCIEFTPLCPHTLFSRPMIFASGEPITVEFRAYQGSSVTVSMDGEAGIEFNEGDRLKLTCTNKALQIIEAGEGFFGAVHNKLMQPLK